MKRFFVMFAGFLVAGMLLLGSGYTRVSLVGLGVTSRNWLDSMKSDAALIAEAKERLAERARKIASFASDIKANEQCLGAAENDLSQLRAEADQQRDSLEKTRRALEDRQAMYFISGRSYSYEELNQDAQIRVSAFTSLKQSIAAKEAANQKLRESLSTARGDLAQAQIAQQQAMNDLQNAEVQLAGANVRATTDKALRLADDSQDPLAPIRHQIWEAQAVADSAGSSGKNGIVNWKDTKSTVSSINDVLR